MRSLCPAFERHDLALLPPARPAASSTGAGLRAGTAAERVKGPGCAPRRSLRGEALDRRCGLLPKIVSFSLSSWFESSISAADGGSTLAASHSEGSCWCLLRTDICEGRRFDPVDRAPFRNSCRGLALGLRPGPAQWHEQLARGWRVRLRRHACWVDWFIWSGYHWTIFLLS
jgi:hypothetical protein